MASFCPMPEGMRLQVSDLKFEHSLPWSPYIFCGLRGLHGILWVFMVSSCPNQRSLAWTLFVPCQKDCTAKFLI